MSIFSGPKLLPVGIYSRGGYVSYDMGVIQNDWSELWTEDISGTSLDC
jgi:hypothetical protein